MNIVDLAGAIDAAVDELNYLRNRVNELENLPPNNRKKLSLGEVADIRKMRRFGVTQADIAAEYGVNPATVSRIVRGIYFK